MAYDPKRVTIFVLVLALLGAGGYEGYKHFFTHPKATIAPKTVTTTVKPQSTTPAKANAPTVKPEDKPIDLTAFEQAWQKQDYKTADKLLAEELKANPYNTDLDIQAATYYEAKSNHDPTKSISFLQGVLNEHPDNDLIRINLAFFQTESKNTNDYATALQNAQQALNDEQSQEGSSGQVPVFFYDTYAWTVGLNGNMNQAFNIYVNDIFKVYKFDDPSSMLHFGLLLESNGNYSYAQQVFNKVLTLSGQSLPAAQANELPWAQTNAKAALARIPGEEASAKSTSNSTGH